MANNKRIQIQHWYTTGNTAPSGTGLTNMLLGEIAIATQTGNEAIFIKNNDGSAVTFMTSAQTDSLITQKLGEAGIGGDDVISTLTQNLGTLTQKLDTHINAPAEADKSGHVFLVSGDVKSETYANGYAAAASHTHSQYQPKGDYLTGVTAGSGLVIDGNIENGEVKLQLSSTTLNDINSGVTALNHLNLSADTWNNTTKKLNTFLADADLTSNTIDTLVEIQTYIETHGSAASEMTTAINSNTSNISTISGVVAGHTTAITQNNNNISSLVTSASTNATKIQSLSQTIGQVSTNVTAINDKIGSGFTPSNTIASEINDLKSQQSNYVTSVIGSGNINAKPTDGVGRQFIVTHTTAGTQTDEITATNYPTGLSFGSEFKIVNKIGYDANGHVVSGSTQTLKLPTVPTATTDNYGTVKIQHGDFGITYELLNTHSGVAADVNHFHSQYAKTSDLGMTINDNVTVISCGVYY